MNFFFRKLIKLGPLRLNLSKSGIGVSAGPKGIKAGVNARGGMYIAGGSHGVRFQHAVPVRTQPRDAKEISAAPLVVLIVLILAFLVFTGIFGYLLYQIIF
jgi:hypothetical protein